MGCEVQGAADSHDKGGPKVTLTAGPGHRHEALGAWLPLLPASCPSCPMLALRLGVTGADNNCGKGLLTPVPRGHNAICSNCHTFKLFLTVLGDS